MLNYLMNSGCDVEAMIEKKKGKIVMEIPFDSKRKRQTTAVRIEQGVRVFVKGATEAIVVLCTKALLEGG